MFGLKKKNKKTDLSLKILPADKNFYFTSGETLLDIALHEELPLSHSCGGMGSCGTCKVTIEKGLEDLEKRNDLEAEWAEERQWPEQERLACQTRAVKDIVFRIPNKD